MQAIENPTTEVSDEQRPDAFKMPIQGGMLEALGINMYTTLGKCLVEFIANAYDGEARHVEIVIPSDRIAVARAEVRRLARERVKAGQTDRFTILLEPLPSDVSVVIKDDGVGMTWKDVRDKFLPLNRKRRDSGAGAETSLKSENGLRYVMGRKGLGKLAGFGAAEIVTIRTKRKNETFATTVVLADLMLKTAPNVTDVPIPATYEDGLDPAEQGTTITLSGLKSDAVKEKLETLEGTILEAFNAVRPNDMEISLNRRVLKPKRPDYEFTYPETLSTDGYASATVNIEDIGGVTFRYYVGFLPRNRHLSAGKRGARVYCNNRLAAGPTLFRLGTGMHSFHSMDYMECIVEADELDRVGVDFVNTNRSMLREDNEVVKAVIDKVTALMTEGIKAHGRFREKQAEDKLNTDPTGKILSEIVRTLPRKTRKPAQKLLMALATEYGVESEQFKDLAPAFINSVNATEVLIQLIHLRSHPETIARVAELLRDLGEMERVDALKLYRGRRDGIAALKILWEQGEEEWRKRGLEKDLHTLLKQCPWLIRPEFSNYLTSDQEMNKVVSKFAKELNIDTFAKIKDGAGPDDRRPDLVFLMSDPSMQGPFILNIVELKSPSLPLTIDHHRQLENYVFQVNRWCKSELSHTVSIRGYLIGAMPPHSPQAADQAQLLEKYASQGGNAEIKIIGLQELIKDAWSVHMDAIKALERSLDEDGVDDSKNAAVLGDPAGLPVLTAVAPP